MEIPIDETNKIFFLEAYTMSEFKYCSLIWMFCTKSSNNQINKIHKRTLHLVYEMEDVKLNVHKNNKHTLLIEIYQSITNLNPLIMKDFFDLKNTRYDLQDKQLLKSPERQYF